jgi:hypothetical protein
MYSDPQANPYERETFNLTRAVRLAQTEPEKARAQFNAAARRGTLEATLATAEEALFPPPPVDPWAWIDERDA